MIKKEIKDFDIDQIAQSGQCFRIEKIEDDKWQILAREEVLKVQKISKNEYLFDCSEKEFQNIWFDYFDFRTDYSEIKGKIMETNDPYLISAIEYGWGIRILRQDLWETIVTFIISQRNNIPRITNTIKRLCNPFGGKFPTPSLLKDYSESDFKKLGLGYRAKFFVDIVIAALDGELDFKYLKSLPTNEALKYLQRFNGIGPKVANCIALFSLHKIEAFPIDVWIQRIIDRRYNGIFPIEKFKGFEGIVQQYMFFYERSLNIDL